MSILLLRYCCNVIVVNNMSTTERYIYTLFVVQYDMSFLNVNPKSPFSPTDGLDYTLLSFALQDKCSLLCHFCL